MIQLSTGEFLIKMKEHIRTGRRHFVKRTRNGVSYLRQLRKLGLADVEQTWEWVLELEPCNYHSGPSPDYGDVIRERVIWVFKSELNDVLTYIKTKG